jgi:hypothetical protein
MDVAGMARRMTRGDDMTNAITTDDIRPARLTKIKRAFRKGGEEAADDYRRGVNSEEYAGFDENFDPTELQGDWEWICDKVQSTHLAEDVDDVDNELLDELRAEYQKGFHTRRAEIQANESA